MANDFNNNPVIIDTAGNVTTVKVPITGFLVVANADAWKCELYNTGAAVYKKIFRAESNATDNERTFSFSPAKPLVTQGIYATTLTNIAEVLVYLDAS